MTAPSRGLIGSRRRRRRLGRSTTAAWLFSAPGLLLLLLFIVTPFLLAVFFSFTNQRLISPLPTRFVGLENYQATLTSATFWRAFKNNMWFALFVVPVETAFALWLAILVNSKSRGRVIFRTIYFMPVITMLATVAVIWTLLFNPRGLINAVMETVTLGGFAPNWLNSTTWALPAVIIVSIWQGVGFQMVILLAALQDVPGELYEAAAIDGAGRWQQFRNVTLPGIRNALIFVVTVTTILAFRLFDQVWIMPQSPGGPLDSTRTMMLEMVETGFGRQQIGRGAALAVVFFLIVLFITLVQRRFVREDGERLMSAEWSAPAAGVRTGRPRTAGAALQYVVMTVLALFFLFPLVFMVASSFKSDSAVLARSDSFAAFAPTPFVGLENYADAVERASFFRVFVNSVVISSAIVGIGLVVNSLLGYALARMRFAGRAFVVALIIALVIIPFEALAVPLLLMNAELGWLDTYHVQILPFIANPLFVYLFYTFFLSIPVSLEEAAQIDGAGPVRTFVSVVAPLARPAYATMAILGFLFSWGQLLWPVMVTRGLDVRPLPLGIGTFKTTQPVQWGDIMAYSVMMTLPLLVVFAIFQRFFIRGVAWSGVNR